MKPTQPQPGGRARSPAKSSVIRLKSILVTTDFSAAFKQTLPLRGELAREFGAKLDLVYVLPDLLSGEIAPANMVAISSQMSGASHAS